MIYCRLNPIENGDFHVARPEHQIEHAEHAAHAAGDDFNRMVTMSIAIVAAILAGVTMLGHRLHNETLISQGEALQIQGDWRFAFRARQFNCKPWRA